MRIGYSGIPVFGYSATRGRSLRCPNCQTENDDGRASCESCGAAFTAYAEKGSGIASAATLAKLAKLGIRPPAVAPMASIDGLLALITLGALIARYFSQPNLNADSSNYLAPAFGAVGAALASFVAIPVALALLYLAWGTWTQRTWAWTANAFLMALSAFLALLAFFSNPILAVIRLAITAYAAFFWFNTQTREWFGAQ